MSFWRFLVRRIYRKARTTYTFMNRRTKTMKYMLLMYANEAEMQKYNTENGQTVAQGWSTLNKEAAAAGVVISTSGLAPVANATTLRVKEGKSLITDGPFAETHE